MKRAKAVYRNYTPGGTRGKQVRRLHVLRETPVRDYSHQRDYPQTWCGQGAGRHHDSDPVIISPMPQQPPEGLSWCPKCIGLLAEYYGLIGEVAASLAAYDPGLTDLHAERLWENQEAQRDVRRTRLLGAEGTG